MKTINKSQRVIFSPSELTIVKLSFKNWLAVHKNDEQLKDHVPHVFKAADNRNKLKSNQVYMMNQQKLSAIDMALGSWGHYNTNARAGWDGWTKEGVATLEKLQVLFDTYTK